MHTNTSCQKLCLIVLAVVVGPVVTSTSQVDLESTVAEYCKTYHVSRGYSYQYVSNHKHPSEVFVSSKSVLSPKQCGNVIKYSEEYATARGGWISSRHYRVPTTDMSLKDMPSVEALVRPLLSIIEANAVEMYGLSGAIVFHDVFVIKYGSDETAQRGLGRHQDSSVVTVQIALNAGFREFEQGGTFFERMNCSFQPDQGHAITFPGQLYHAGVPITSGVRYVLVGFSSYADGGTELVDAVTPASFGLPYRVLIDDPTLETPTEPTLVVDKNGQHLLHVGVQYSRTAAAKNHSFVAHTATKSVGNIGLVWIQRLCDRCEDACVRATTPAGVSEGSPSPDWSNTNTNRNTNTAIDPNTDDTGTFESPEIIEGNLVGSTFSGRGNDDYNHNNDLHERQVLQLHLPSNWVQQFKTVLLLLPPGQTIYTSYLLKTG
eukprot:m.128416 g.128416  ORF g.128416 m.128416 type:complete len:432 (-) comp29334_c0_seq3:39-1334(-)